MIVKKLSKREIELMEYDNFAASVERDMEIIWGMIARYEAKIRELQKKIWDEFGVSGEIMLGKFENYYREVM